MTRKLFFAYGVFAHGLFLFTYAWMACFVGNFLVPTAIDGPASGSIGVALVIDGLLLVLFAVQHSVMARPSFKRQWTRIIPRPIERSTYVLISCALVWLLMWQWRPIGVVIWDMQAPALRVLMYALFAVGWLLVPVVSFMTGHFDLFGTRQVWMYLKGRDYRPLNFRAPMLYSHVRHPMYIGWAIAFWATPTMTLAHLVFAVALTGYMLAAIPLEERNLVEHLGRDYAEYRRRVPMLLPRLRRWTRRPAEAEHDAAPTSHGHGPQTPPV